MAKRCNLIKMLIVTTAVSVVFSCTFAQAQTLGDSQYSGAGNYYTYYSDNQNEKRAIASISANFDKAENSSGLTENNGRQGVVLDSDNSWCEWSINVTEAGLYNLMLDYYPLPGTGLDAQIQLQIDGETPFSEANTLSFPRVWENKSDSGIKKDDSGNEIRPEQTESPKWKNIWLYSEMGISEKPYYFKLTEGKHIVRLNIKRENVMIGSLLFAPAPVPVDYETYISKYSLAQKPENSIYKLEGEAAFEKNSSLLTPTYDTSNANMSPRSDPAHIVLNSIGGNGTWSRNGQEFSWKIGAETAAGLYQLQLRVKQDLEPGTTTYRKLMINGEVPFTQAESISFPYSDNWYIKTLGDDNPQLVYLKPGDVLTLQATTGKAAEILRMVNKAVVDLNELYRKIIIVTGVNPDTYRDYDIEKEIPTLIDDLGEQKKNINKLSEMIKKLMGKPTSQTAILDQLALMMGGFISIPSGLPENLGSFKGLIDGVASIIFSLNQQSLELDVMYIKSENSPSPKANKGFFESFWFGLQRFYASFVSSDNIGPNVAKSTISVWCMTGRDQAQIIKRLVAEDFTKSTGIEVGINFTGDENTLYQALMAGKGPDVSLMLKTETPINLALRGTAVNLLSLDLPISDEYKNEFYDSAFVPFKYKGGLYALPETQTFDVMFYRSDLIKSLGLSVPKTWDEFYKVTKVLHSNHMVMGILETDSEIPGVSQSVTYFYDQLLQHGGTFFNSDMMKTGFDTKAAYEASEKWVKLYQAYGFERSFDFASMMRTGEMPIGISSYSTYARIAATAPEISGLWTIAPIPGTIMPDGSINNACTASTTGCSMMNTAVKDGKTKEAFAFMKWWTGSKTQEKYSAYCEAILGIGGRCFPANKEAFNHIGWTIDEKKVLTQQWRKAVGKPQVPGSYIIERSLTNILRQTLESRSEPSRTLAIYNNDINSELARKDKEFNKNR